MHALMLTAWLGCQALDLGTTYAALHRPGYAEGNAVLRGPQLYAVKVGANAGLALYHLAVRRRHAVAIPAVMAGAGCAAGGWNLGQLR